ncbi:MAG: aspartate dehydrogenase [Nitrospinaceae bacterium]|jgi:aspartate dehydrogenase|nr:aspartate dehydrogenase [Nitrospinaceae bacterium]MBT3432538.1 aspartate dehydrogenase [Nitrospinaceae bacterium]MBT3821660.1 aspartate dehydrogenase [Nitrospinaceae bacterium]MBT4094857.1 aspartate dehydrogenase [Nitrospinaceae bacterium]MBT4431895.1 aspartate dehydrogenase [Nitrospinaceae bacterium]
MDLGVIGLGVIGKAVVRAADEGELPFTVSAAATRTPGNVRDFLNSLKNAPRLTDLAGVVASSDVILEASGGHTVEAICRAALPLGKSVIVNSVGALLEREDLIALAEKHKARIMIPSGAIIGLDGLKGAAAGRIDSVTMTTRKPPPSLKGAPFVEENNIDVDAMTEATVIFEGSPLEACKGFPANVNVSAAVSFAGIGPHRTEMRIMCDPTINRNIHEVEAVGEFGRLFFRIENVPTENHRTGILTYLSNIQFLRQQTATLVVGT